MIQCKFSLQSPGIIKCTRCGTVRRTNQSPEWYRRMCDVQEDSDQSMKTALSVIHGIRCAHQGDKIADGVCNVCGMKGQPFDVYACALHGQCMTRRFRNDRPDLKVCANCDDFEAADQTRVV
jgi:ribosomal protein L32